ncbi:hypothetical protein, partial [Phaeodactylibacter luteus]
LQNQFGCDSLVVTTTDFAPLDTTFVQATTCDPAQAGQTTDVLLTPEGCDSVVVTFTQLLPSDTTIIMAATCDPDLAGEVQQSFVNQFGCDSTVITITQLLPSDTTIIMAATCDPGLAGEDQQSFVNQFGCDSTVITITQLLPSDTTIIMAATCDPDLAGEVQQSFVNQSGCDSTVITITQLLPSDLVQVQASSCDPAQAGTDTLFLQNQAGCDSIVVITTQLVQMQAQAGITSDYNGFAVSCEGGSDAQLSAEVTTPGFQPPFSFIWSDGAQGPQRNGVPAGAYTVTVTDANGCSATASVTAQSPPPILLSLSVSPISCFGDQDGGIQAMAQGGLPPFLFSRDGAPFQAQPLFAGLQAGAYTLAVQDANGCEQQAAVIIPQPDELAVSLGPDTTIQAGTAAALSAQLNVPESQIDTIVWQPRFETECPQCLQQTVAPIVSTAYSITITDVNG